MAKRFGNVLTARDLRSEGVDAGAVRHLVFGTHYRKQLDLTDEALEASRRGRGGSAISATAGARRAGARGGAPAFGAAAAAFRRDVGAALDDDLNAPRGTGGAVRLSGMETGSLDAGKAPRSGGARSPRAVGRGARRGARGGGRLTLAAGGAPERRTCRRRARRVGMRPLPTPGRSPGGPAPGGEARPELRGGRSDQGSPSGGRVRGRDGRTGRRGGSAVGRAAGGLGGLAAIRRPAPVDSLQVAMYHKSLCFSASFPGFFWALADVAQLAEHLICNQAVGVRFSPSALARQWRQLRFGRRCGVRRCGGVPEWPTGADCKSAGSRLRRFESFPHHVDAGAGCEWASVAGVAQLVERKPSKLDVAGSSPVSRFETDGTVTGRAGTAARVAQLVEHTLGKGEVIGSIPVASLREAVALTG